MSEATDTRPDVVIILTDEERAAPSYEGEPLTQWRSEILTGRRWFDENAVTFGRHYTGSLACVPSRPTMFTGQFPDVHGVTQTDGLGKMANDSRMRWLRPGEVPTLGHWFRAAGYDTHYDGKWHITHADLTDPETGEALATNDDEGRVDPAAVQAYLDADPLGPFGFSGWVGPEPHGASLANSGLRRDDLIAERVTAWLADRYERRRDGDPAALVPFLLVASFVNPHDIVLFPAWARKSPIDASPLDPPAVPASPTDDEDLASKPAAQIAFREAYPSGYGPAAGVARIYRNGAQRYRDLYYRLHAEVDGPLDRVRRAVTEHGSQNAVLIRTSDHGEMLGSHGGLHQKWFNLYDEVTRVPFQVARVGEQSTGPRTVDDMPTSHTDLVPTALAAAGIDQAEVQARLSQDFTEVHPLPGRELMSLVDGATEPDPERAVYLVTRDNMLEGDSGASGVARRIKRDVAPPAPLRIQVPAHVATNFQAVVARIGGAQGHLWKVVRTFDDPDTWTEPGVRHLAAHGPAGPEYRTEALEDQWELYDLTADPIELHNRWDDPASADAQAELVVRLDRESVMPERNVPWGYETRRPTAGPDRKKPPAPARLLRRLAQRLGMHPDDEAADPTLDLTGHRALIVCTNHAVLDIGKATGLFASEMTAPYYVFVDAGMEVDIASPAGGTVPVDPISIKPVLRSEHDDRFLADDDLKAKVTESLAVADVNVDDYSIVFLAGGWGAAFDFGTSVELASQITRANELGRVIGGVCHGPLGLINATDTDGSPLVEGRRVSGVTDKQVRELGISITPMHPETELRRVGAAFESQTAFRDPFANHWVVDGNLVTGQNQNAGPMVAREMLQLLDADQTSGASPSK